MEELNLKENPGMIRDRVGEVTDLSLCPECAAHPDCFANIEGRCTALKKVEDDILCPFYKNAEANIAEAKRCYQRLKESGRSDLISRYIKPLSAMGMLDDEIESAAQYGEEFDAFRESNYQEQLARALEEDGLDDDLLDGADDADVDGYDTDDDADGDADDGVEDETEGEEDEDAWEPGWTDPGDDGRA